MEEEISNTPITDDTERPEVTRRAEGTDVTTSRTSRSQSSSNGSENLENRSAPSMRRHHPAAGGADGESLQAAMSDLTLSTDSSSAPLLENREQTSETGAAADVRPGKGAGDPVIQEKPASPSSSPSHLPSLEDLIADLQRSFLLCPRCQSVFDGLARCPQSLPCGHALCASCLGGCDSGSSVPCPLCSKDRQHPQAGRADQQSHADLSRLKLLELIQRSQTGGQREVSQEDSAAEAPGLGVRFLARLAEELLRCAICQSLMEEGPGHPPRLLPCRHVLCAACLQRLADPASARCHECRQSFTAQECTSHVMLERLLQWLLPFREHLPALTSQLDDVTARVYDLQESLERQEERVQELLEQKRLFVSLLSLFGHLEDNEILRAAWKDLADTCLKTVLETLQLGIDTSKEVWSLTKLVFGKMLEHLDDSSGFSKALAETDAVKIFSENCRHSPFLANLEDERKKFIVNASLDILYHVAAQEKAKKLFLSSSSAEAAAEFLSVDHLEDGMAYRASQLLRRLSEVLSEHRAELLSHLGAARFAERCVRLLEVGYTRYLARDQSVMEAIHAIYKMVRTFAGHRGDFAEHLAGAGAVALLTRNCTRLELLAEITNENWTFLVELSSETLCYIARNRGMTQHFEESSTLKVLPPLFSCGNPRPDILIYVLFTAHALIEYTDGKGWNNFGDSIALTGFTQALPVLVKLSAAKMSTMHDVERFSTLCSALAQASCHSSLIRKALAEAGLVQLLTENLQSALLQRIIEEARSSLTTSVLGLLLNMAWDPDMLQFFQKSKTVQALEPLLQYKGNEVLRQAAFMTAAYIYDVKSPILNEKELTAETVSILRKASEAPDGTYRGRSHHLPVLFFVRNLARLSLRESSRSQILEMDVVPLLEKVVAEGDSEERRFALLCKARLLSDYPDAVAEDKERA